MQIEPQTLLPLVYQLTDPSDSGTYYVRAVVKNTRTGATIETINLASQGSGRFTGSFNAPVDPTGFGFHIDVVISVYTDSGYTTYSDVYARELHQYLVKKTVGMFGGMGGGGGAEVDYDKIRKMLVEVVTEKFTALEAKLPKTVSLKKVLMEIGDVKGIVKEIKPTEIPEQVPTDLSPVQQLIAETKASLEKAIADKEVTKVELEPLMNLVTTLGERVTSLENGVRAGEKVADEIKKAMQEFYTNMNENVNKRTEKLKGVAKSFLDEFEESGAPKKESVPSPFDNYFNKK